MLPYKETFGRKRTYGDQGDCLPKRTNTRESLVTVVLFTFLYDVSH